MYAWPKSAATSRLAQGSNKITHEGLFKSLKHSAIPIKSIDMVKSLYRFLAFIVTIYYFTSSKSVQGIGVRQGCLLSHSFFWLMHVVFVDVKIFCIRFHLEEVVKVSVWLNLQNIITCSMRVSFTFFMRMTRIVFRFIDQTNSLYCILLNKEKSVLISYNSAGQVKFMGGTPVKKSRRDVIFWMWY